MKTVFALLLLALALPAQAAGTWPQTRPGAVTEVKGYRALPERIKAVPELRNCISDAAGDPCAEMISRFYSVGESHFALIPIDGLFDQELLFTFDNNEVTQLSVATGGADVGFSTTTILGEVKVDARSGALSSTYFEDTCDAETTTTEFTYRLVEGIYYLHQVRESVGCETETWKILWEAKT